MSSCHRFIVQVTILLLFVSFDVLCVSAVLDDCDRYKWRQCETDLDCEWDTWKHSSYQGSGCVQIITDMNIVINHLKNVNLC